MPNLSRILSCFFQFSCISFAFDCQSGINSLPIQTSQALEHILRNAESMTASRFAFICLSLLLILGLWAVRPELCRLVSAQDENKYLSTLETSARYSATDFLPDGNLAKKVWKNASWIEFEHDTTGKIENPTVRTRVAAVWSD